MASHHGDAKVASSNLAVGIGLALFALFVVVDQLCRILSASTQLAQLYFLIWLLTWNTQYCLTLQ